MENDELKRRLNTQFSDEDIQKFAFLSKNGIDWMVSNYWRVLDTSEAMEIKEEAVITCNVAYVSGKYKGGSAFSFGAAVVKNVMKQFFKRQKRTVPVFYDFDYDETPDSTRTEKSKLLFEDFSSILSGIDKNIFRSLTETHDFYKESSKYDGYGVESINLSALAKHHNLTREQAETHVKCIFHQSREYGLMDSFSKLVRKTEKTNT